MMTIDLNFDARSLQAVIQRLERLPSRRADAIQRIMRDGVLANYDALAWGGHVQAAGGGSVAWSRVRNRMTVAVRRSRGLAALFPILSFTGKLRRGLASGTASRRGDSLSWAPSADIRALVRTHQYGLAPLPSLSSRSIFRSRPLGDRRVPKREILFWSAQMARQVEALARAEVKK